MNLSGCLLKTMARNSRVQLYVDPGFNSALCLPTFEWPLIFVRRSEIVGRRSLNTCIAGRTDDPKADSKASSATIRRLGHFIPRSDRADSSVSGNQTVRNASKIPNLIRTRPAKKVRKRDSSDTQADTEGAPSHLPWQVQKAALKEKFGDEGWAPRKKLSPDSQEKIRMLHADDPIKNSTKSLAESFKISPEAIRRILKSRWRPTKEEVENRHQRWIRRGERIWTELASRSVKPPRQWRERGIVQRNTISDSRFNLDDSSKSRRTTLERGGRGKEITHDTSGEIRGP